MPCIHCDADRTIEAHLIPRAFVQEIKHSAGEKHLIIHRNAARTRASNTGIYDRDILCQKCDGILGRYEGYAYSLLKSLREVKAPSGTFVPVEPVDGDTLVRFAAGIAWKYAVTKPENGRLSLGPYTAILSRVALDAADIPPSIDLTMMRIVELDGDVYYYRAPLLDRKEDLNVVRFCVGSFLFFMKIDKRPNGRNLPPECWLRGRSKAAFVTGPAEIFEEGKLHANFAGSRPVRKFFQKMRATRQVSRN
jgi:hypothetical protein